MVTDRWAGIVRPYDWADVKKLQGRTKVKHTLAENGANRLWTLMTGRPHVAALGASTANMAVEQVKAGLEAIYCSGWQVAADANSVPELVKRINAALLRAEQIQHAEGGTSREWMAPIVADAEAGFCGPINVFEITKAMIAAGAGGVHLEDQLVSEKKCGYLGGKVMIPTGQFIRSLTAARLAADVCEVSTVIIARTDALSAQLLTSDHDDRDKRFITGDRTPEGFFRLGGDPMERTIERALNYAPYADLLWFETSEPDVDQAKQFADAIHAVHPGKMLAYNFSPSFNWKKLDAVTIGKFQEQLGQMGYKFQFVTLAGFHSQALSMFKLAHLYSQSGMTAYADLQEEEFRQEQNGYTATKHQREVGTGYFNKVAEVTGGGQSSTLVLGDSAEKRQF